MIHFYRTRKVLIQPIYAYNKSNNLTKILDVFYGFKKTKAFQNSYLMHVGFYIDDIKLPRLELHWIVEKHQFIRKYV